MFSDFTDSVPYKNIKTDHEREFNAFLAWAKKGIKFHNIDTKFAIQFVEYPNFVPSNKSVEVYSYDGKSFCKVTSMPAQFKKASASKTSKLGRVLGMPTAYFSS
jgi:hypothetical protein